VNRQGDEKKAGGLKPAAMLSNVLSVVPELRRLSNADLQIVCNKDSARMGCACAACLLPLPPFLLPPCI
jgi:hypothetical protein